MVNTTTPEQDGTSMEPMPQTKHAKPKDHLWVLVLIAAACGLEVCATWTGIGARSGFPVIRLPFGIARIPTDFCLMVCMEAYAGYGLYIWLTAPGRRSGPFAMWSAIVAIGFSLTGQVAYHVTGTATMLPPWLIGFVSALPVIALLLVAILIHLVRLDRAEAEESAEHARAAVAQAQREAAETSELTAVRAELDAARAAAEPLRADLETARTELARVTAKAESLTAKLDALSAQRKRKRTAQKPVAKSAQEDDLTTEMRALTEMENDPSLRGPRKGGELARRLGVSAPTGRRLHVKLTAQDRSGEPLSERSADQSDERSDERS